MAYIQKLICSNVNYDWSSEQDPLIANGIFIDNIALAATPEQLLQFQEAFASVHNQSFNESLEIVDGKLHVSRSWTSLDDYNNYKGAIESIENEVNEKMREIGWEIVESISEA